MNTNKRLIAITELVLILPAGLFLMAVLARQLQPLQYEPAHTAQQIVTWYAIRHWTLWVLLIGLPVAALFAGGVTLLQDWTQGTGLPRLHPATLIITLAAGLILAVVALHMLAN